MYKELADDIGCVRQTPHLQDWAREGVLLLNTVLTVRQGEANSHRDIGWETFTDEIIKAVSDYKEHVVFIFCGGNLHSKKIKLIDTSKHCIIKSVHPSPLSAYRGILWIKTVFQSEYLFRVSRKTPINWCESEA